MVHHAAARSTAEMRHQSAARIAGIDREQAQCTTPCALFAQPALPPHPPCVEQRRDRSTTVTASVFDDAIRRPPQSAVMPPRIAASCSSLAAHPGSAALAQPAITPARAVRWFRRPVNQESRPASHQTPCAPVPPCISTPVNAGDSSTRRRRAGRTARVNPCCAACPVDACWAAQQACASLQLAHRAAHSLGHDRFEDVDVNLCNS
jgi:hypothetical protein